jgi:hypothetical protein
MSVRLRDGRLDGVSSLAPIIHTALRALPRHSAFPDARDRLVDVHVRMVQDLASACGVDLPVDHARALAGTVFTTIAPALQAETLEPAPFDGPTMAALTEALGWSVAFVLGRR